MANHALRCGQTARRAVLNLETLETRYVLSGVQPTAQEQLFLEQLNDVRANPAAYGAQIGLPALAGVAAAPPLALDARLIQSAQGHSADMNVNNYFGHYDKQGHDPGYRETQAGYSWSDFGESIAAGYPTTAATLQALIVDTGVSDLGHRLHLLAMNNSDESVGVGVVQNGSGAYGTYYTIDTGNTSDTRPFITGVIFNDANGNGKYDAGEGLSGVTVTVAGVGSVQACDTGGYSLQVNPGTYTVTASGGQLGGTVTQQVTVGATNFRLNFTAGAATQMNNFPGNLNWAANTITHSSESFGNFVDNAYQSYLKRNPTGAEANYWIGQMGNGMTDEQIEASFIGSPEYIHNHGNSNAAWIAGMYQDLLGRSASQPEITNWLQQMSHGMSPTQVALGFATSAERESQRIGNTYEVVLGRQASSSEITYWVSQYQHGATNESVAAGFLASQEFWNNMGKGTAATWTQVVYQDVLHRTPNSSESGYWGAQIH